tara:strand:+ start:793 stop:2841 length:2049 start_codon:yes stop_codon:yes gene_type:complete
MRLCITLLICLAISTPSDAEPLQWLDAFKLQFATEPQISPDGENIAYIRVSGDIKTDKFQNRLWLISADDDSHQRVGDTHASQSSPSWSPDGNTLAFSQSKDDNHTIQLSSPDKRKSNELVSLENGASGLTWSPDGNQIAFIQFVEEEQNLIVDLPTAPKGAEWAKEMIQIDKPIYRRDGSGYVKYGYDQVFIVDIESGEVTQVTSDDYDHSGPFSWSKDGASIYIAGQFYADWEHTPRAEHLYKVNVATGEKQLFLELKGPASVPSVSPDGNTVAFLGFVDDKRSFQQTDVFIVPATGGDPVNLTGEFDRSISALQWHADGKSIFVQYDDHGVGCVGRVNLDASMQVDKTTNVGGTVVGRPYQGGSFSAADDGTIAFTSCTSMELANISVDSDGNTQQLTELNKELFSKRDVGQVDRITYKSSIDQREIDGWIAYPPGYSEDKKYPLILEIHGGPFANYGSRFAMEIQLYAAAGYVVLYTNPRGSTSYGEEFTDLIDHNYPCQEDYQDMMDGVDTLISNGTVDPERLYVTGGSGGGILTAWIVTKTDRFKAAVSQKPVINWATMAYTSDAYMYFSSYWFSDAPWNPKEMAEYVRRSPLTYVDKVKTPTMLMTGEQDYRTPITEAEQFYQALQLRKVDTMMIRVPDSSHSIASKPSRIMAKVGHVLAWFAEYGGEAIDDKSK